jgi:hypothetical protein
MPTMYGVETAAKKADIHSRSLKPRSDIDILQDLAAETFQDVR